MVQLVVSGWRDGLLNCLCVLKGIKTAGAQRGHYNEIWLMGFACLNPKERTFTSSSSVHVVPIYMLLSHSTEGAPKTPSASFPAPLYLLLPLKPHPVLFQRQMRTGEMRDRVSWNLTSTRCFFSPPLVNQREREGKPGLCSLENQALCFFSSPLPHWQHTSVLGGRRAGNGETWWATKLSKSWPQ